MIESERTEDSADDDGPWDGKVRSTAPLFSILDSRFSILDSARGGFCEFDAAIEQGEYAQRRLVVSARGGRVSLPMR